MPEPERVLLKDKELNRLLDLRKRMKRGMTIPDLTGRLVPEYTEDDIAQIEILIRKRLDELMPEETPAEAPEEEAQRLTIIAPVQQLTIDGVTGFYQVAMPQVSWDVLNPNEMVNQLVILEVDKEGEPMPGAEWQPVSKQVMADAGWNAAGIRSEIIYNTMRQDLLSRGVDPTVLNMPEVENFIVEQSVTQKPGVQSNYIDQLVQKLGQVGQDPIQGGTILEDFSKQLKAQAGQFEQIKKLALGQFPEPRNLAEAKQFAEEKSRRVEDMVARGQMTSKEKDIEKNNIERELEEWNQKFQGISQGMDVALQRAQGLQNFYAGAPTNAPTEREYRLAQVQYFQPLVDEWRKTFEAQGFDPRTMDVGQQVAFAGYDAYNNAVQRLEAIGGGGAEEPGYGEAPDTAIQKPFRFALPDNQPQPFKSLVREARNRQRKVSI